MQNRCTEGVVLWLSAVGIFLIRGVRDQVTPKRGAQYLRCYSYAYGSDHFWSDPPLSFITPSCDCWVNVITLTLPLRSVMEYK